MIHWWDVNATLWCVFQLIKIIAEIATEMNKCEIRACVLCPGVLAVWKRYVAPSFSTTLREGIFKISLLPQTSWMTLLLKCYMKLVETVCLPHKDALKLISVSYKKVVFLYRAHTVCLGGRTSLWDWNYSATEVSCRKSQAWHQTRLNHFSNLSIRPTDRLIYFGFLDLTWIPSYIITETKKII